MKNKKAIDSNVILENFRSYWSNRETSECFSGIAVLMNDEGFTGKELKFETRNPGTMPTILLDGEYWQVKSLKLTGNQEMELNLVSNSNTKKVRISDEDIDKFEAYKLLCAVFDETEHEKGDGEDYEDVEDFYAWELS